MHTAEDKELSGRLQKGDIEAFDLLYHRYASRLYAFGMKYLKSESDSEELVQSVFTRLWESHRKIDKELSVRSYLFTIAYNDICKLFRSRTYLKKYIDDTLATSSVVSSGYEESIEYRSALEQVNKIIEILPEKQKAAFIKSKIDGISSREIASELGLSVGTVDNYISDTLRFIRRNVEKATLPAILFCFVFLF